MTADRIGCPPDDITISDSTVAQTWKAICDGQEYKCDARDCRGPKKDPTRGNRVSIAAAAPLGCRLLGTASGNATRHDTAAKNIVAAQTYLQNRAFDLLGNVAVITSQHVDTPDCPSCANMTAFVYQCPDGANDTARTAGSARPVPAVASTSSSQAAPQESALQRTLTAKVLYEHAVQAMGRKDYATACPALAEAVQLEPGAVGGWIALAECYEGAGRLASAWSAYALAEAAAAKAGQSDRRQKAHERGEALGPRLARLTIVVPDAWKPLPGLEIRRDGVPVGPAQWGLPMPVDKGSHLVVVKATGKRPIETKVDVAVDGVALTFQAPMPGDAPPP